MAQGFLSYSVDNDNRFKGGLRRALETSSDLRVPFGLILRDFYKSEQAIFNLQSPGQYPDLGGLQPDSPVLDRHGKPTGKTRRDRAIESKYKRTGGIIYPILLGKTGKLARSITSADAEGSVAQITATSMVFGSSIPYGIYHQSDAKRTTIPLRKFIFIGPEAPRFATSQQMGRLERWLNILNDHVLKTMKRAVAGGV